MTASPVRVPEGVRARPRLLLGLVLLVLVAAALLLGERPAPLSDLEDAIDSGRVGEVAVSAGLSPHSSGYATQRIHWSTGIAEQVTDVVQVRGSGPSVSTGDLPVLHRDAATYLRARHPGLDVTRGDGFSSNATVIGREVPQWLGLVGLVGMGALLVLLVGGPQPWVATKWAWFWMFGLPLGLGVLGFLLLAGPTRGLSAPEHPERRLTGGKAFLLTVAVGLVWSAATT